MEAHSACMHLKFTAGNAQQQAVARALDLSPLESGEICVDARPDNLDRLLTAARVHCLSKVTIMTPVDRRRPFFKAPILIILDA